MSPDDTVLSTRAPSLRCVWLAVPELQRPSVPHVVMGGLKCYYQVWRRYDHPLLGALVVWAPIGGLTGTIDRQLKEQILTFFRDKVGQISNFTFLTPKNHFLGRVRRIMTYCVWGCVQRCDLWAW